MGLTPKQKEILDYITTFNSKKGFAPSQHEIARHFGFKSLGTVQNYLVRLERQGALTKNWNERRGMKVVTPQPISEAVLVPLLGRVAAGHPIEAIQSHETLEVPASMLNGPDHFVLRVAGDSMIEDGILNGDYVVIRKQATALNGQTVVALINNEATIKTYYRRGASIELHPANPAYAPIIVKPSHEGIDFRIEGVLVGVIRKCAPPKLL